MNHYYKRKAVLEIIAMIYVTIVIILSIPNMGWFMFFMGMLCFITFPVILVSLFLFFRAFRFKYRKDKIILALGLINILSLFYLFTRTISYAEDMEDFYEDNKVELNELCSYTRSAILPNSSVYIEFENDTISIFNVSTPNDSIVSDNYHETKVNNDSLMRVAGLTSQELSEIKQRLYHLGCISISSDSKDKNQTTVGYKRVGMGLYSFLLYNRPITSSKFNEYLEDMSTIPYNSKVIFLYSSGAIGNMDFDGKEEYLNKLSKKSVK